MEKRILDENSYTKIFVECKSIVWPERKKEQEMTEEQYPFDDFDWENDFNDAYDLN